MNSTDLYLPLNWIIKEQEVVKLSEASKSKIMGQGDLMGPQATRALSPHQAFSIPPPQGLGASRGLHMW